MAMTLAAKELFDLMAARRGHFQLESGHHGDLWLDVDRLFVEPRRVRPHAAALAERLDAHHVHVICGPLTGGAFLAQMVAEEAGVPWVYADPSPGAASDAMFPVDYFVPHELTEFVRGRRVAIVNDVINAGSAVRGTLASLRGAGANVAVIAALLVLGNSAHQMAAGQGVPLESLVHASNCIWTPAECPLCLIGSPLIDRAG